MPSEPYWGPAGGVRSIEEKLTYDALIVIGWRRIPLQAVDLFTKEFDYPVIGLPGTIDNDLRRNWLYNQDMILAINTVINAVDKIQDTARISWQLFIVEVMGRDSGLIALRSGIGVGAESNNDSWGKYGRRELSDQAWLGRKDKASKIIYCCCGGDEVGGGF